MVCCTFRIFLPSSPQLGGGITANLDRGFHLAGSSAGSIGIAILALIILTGTVFLVYFGTKRNRPASGVGQFGSSDIVLNNYDQSRAEGTGYTHLRDRQRGRGSL